MAPLCASPLPIRRFRSALPWKRRFCQMPRKSLRKLAGCIVIELLFGWTAVAADYQFKAGYSTYGQAKALAIEDLRGHRALIVSGAFSIPLSIADLIAASAIKEFNFERPNLLIGSFGSGDPSLV